MTHGSLFSGIGGFDLAAEWMGWDNKFHCEWNPFCQQILKYYWPNAKTYGDIDKSDFTIWRGLIDVLSGGFPCQPYSLAGKRKGKEDDRHKWPQMLRAIREIQPRWIVGENVRGLTNWNGGVVFDEVQADMEAEGYEVLPFLLPACGVGADHQRYRIYPIAHHNSGGYGVDHRAKQNRRKKKEIKGNEQREERKELQRERDGVIIGGISSEIVTTNNIGQGLQVATCREQREIQSQASTFERGKFSGGITEVTRWEGFPTQPPFCSRNDGIPCKLDGVTFSKWRNESIKAFGNAVVPQVVLQIFKAIEEYEKQNIN